MYVCMYVCMYIYIMFVTLVLIFKFILIYLLRVLFVLKIESIFEKKSVERDSFFIYILYRFISCLLHLF